MDRLGSEWIYRHIKISQVLFHYIPIIPFCLLDFLNREIEFKKPGLEIVPVRFIPNIMPAKYMMIFVHILPCSFYII